MDTYIAMWRVDLAVDRNHLPSWPAASHHHQQLQQQGSAVLTSGEWVRDFPNTVHYRAGSEFFHDGISDSFLVMLQTPLQHAGFKNHLFLRRVHINAECVDGGISDYQLSEQPAGFRFNSLRRVHFYFLHDERRTTILLLEDEVTDSWYKYPVPEVLKVENRTRLYLVDFNEVPLKELLPATWSVFPTIWLCFNVKAAAIAHLEPIHLPPLPESSQPDRDVVEWELCKRKGWAIDESQNIDLLLMGGESDGPRSLSAILFYHFNRDGSLYVCSWDRRHAWLKLTLQGDLPAELRGFQYYPVHRSRSLSRGGFVAHEYNDNGLYRVHVDPDLQSYSFAPTNRLELCERNASGSVLVSSEFAKEGDCWLFICYEPPALMHLCYWALREVEAPSDELKEAAIAATLPPLEHLNKNKGEEEGDGGIGNGEGERPTSLRQRLDSVRCRPTVSAECVLELLLEGISKNIA